MSPQSRPTTPYPLSRLDYIKYVAGMPQQLIDRLQKVENCSARLISRPPNSLMLHHSWLNCIGFQQLKTLKIKFLPYAKRPSLTCLTCFTCTSHPVRYVPLLSPALFGFRNKRKRSTGSTLFLSAPCHVEYTPILCTPRCTMSRGIYSHTLYATMHHVTWVILPYSVRYAAPCHVEYTPILCTLRCTMSRGIYSHTLHATLHHVTWNILPYSARYAATKTELKAQLKITLFLIPLSPWTKLLNSLFHFPSIRPTPTFPLSCLHRRVRFARAPVCVHVVCVCDGGGGGGGGGNQWMHYFVSFKLACCHYYCF